MKVIQEVLKVLPVPSLHGEHDSEHEHGGFIEQGLNHLGSLINDELEE